MRPKNYKILTFYPKGYLITCISKKGMNAAKLSISLNIFYVI